MKYRRLGSTGLEVSEIGFGTWGIGGPVEGVPAYGPVDESESASTLRIAFESGVNFYDTSNLYGAGRSERIIGETFQDVRGNILVATKAGMCGTPHGGKYSSDHIKRSLEESLKRLKTDYVDLFQLHGPSIADLEANLDMMNALDSLRRDGTIRAIGISINSPDDGESAITKFGFECIQVNFNLIDQRALGNGLLDLCQKKDVGVIIKTPLCFGFLTGTYDSDTEFTSGDQRGGWSPTQRKIWAEAGQRFANAVRQDGEKQSEAQIALRYCLSYPGVSSVIPGMLTRKHLEDNLPASQLGPLSESELAAIEAIYKENVFFVSG